MKSIHKYMLGFVMLTSTSFISVDDVVTALKNGSAAQLSRYFDNTIDISLPEKTNVYSKSQAELVLRYFFSNNIVKSFEVLHRGDNAGSQFFIGSLETNNGTYRTTIYLKQKGEMQLVQELRFEK